MSKPHIMHVTYDMNIGGTEQVIRNLIEGTRSDYQISLLCIDGNLGPWGEELRDSGISCHIVSRKVGFDLRLIGEIRRLLRRERVDLLHCHQYTPYCYGWFASRLLGIPVVFTEHGRFYPDVRKVKRCLINPFLQAGTAAITSISAATKEALVDYENFSPDKIKVIYNGIKDVGQDRTYVDASTDGAKPDSVAITFGTVSRFDPIKNQAMMLEAFAEVHRQFSNVRLVLIGDGEEREALENIVRSRGLSDVVEFTGWQVNPIQTLKTFDVFLLSSLSEGTSMVLLEAMACGIPAVVTDAGGNPEIVADADTGFVTPNKDASAFAKAMLELVGSPSLRQQLSVNARARYESMFTITAMAEGYSTLYEASLSS